MWSLLLGGGLVTKIVMAILLCAALAGGGFLIKKSAELTVAKHTISNLNVKVNQLIIDNDTLKKNVETITAVNKINVETNNKLLEERKDAQAAIATLAKQKLANKKQLDDANKKIDEMLKDPKNNGQVAPVLRETIKSIQEKK